MMPDIIYKLLVLSGFVVQYSIFSACSSSPTWHIVAILYIQQNVNSFAHKWGENISRKLQETY